MSDRETTQPDVGSKVTAALDGLSGKREAIQKRRAEKPQWASSCHLSIPGWAPINIQVARDIPLLVFAIGTLKRLGKDLEAYECDAKWEGYAISDWVQDLEQRVIWLRDDATLQKIHALEAKVQPLLTEDQSRAREMDALADSLAALLGD